ncbi:MAG TPA: hypothetical protein VMF13_01510 [Luteitalea sp.]|nr:hypothetical protein [Luteitalea sp.]
MHRRLLLAGLGGLLILAPTSTSAQSHDPTAKQAAAFIGTWDFAMTNPAGSQQTIKIWEESGALAATVQVGKFPPIAVTRIVKDGEMLVLSVSHDARPGLRENGEPIWAVLVLTADGETMRLAQLLEKSETIKRGTGQRRRA